jgi:hypothetical protein
LGKCTGANPTDRSKCATKRSMVVDGKGVPLGITVDAANRHDMPINHENTFIGCLPSIMMLLIE